MTESGREFDVVANTRYPSTSSTISIELAKLGVKTGDTLLVHSSLSRLGWVCGGPIGAIIGIMMAVGTGGNIVMPAYTGENSDPAEWTNPPVPEDWFKYVYLEMPAFNPDYTPTRGMGVIAETFRSFPDTVRSDHPQSSFCAAGPNAEDIVREHDLSPQFGRYSPLGKLYDMNAKVLLLGTDYLHCSCFHMGETLSKNMKMCKNGTAVDTGEARQWIWFSDYDYDSSDFDRLGAAFENAHTVNIGKVGLGECRLFSLKEAVDFAKTWIEENRNQSSPSV